MAYVDEVLALNPAWYLRLGEATGTIAEDATANNRDGTWNGTPTLGVAGALTGDADKAATLSGDDWVNLASVALGTSYWVKAWIKFVDTADSYNMIVARDAIATGEARHFQLRANATGQIEFIVEPYPGSHATSPASYDDGNWHFAFGVVDWDGTTRTQRLYVDGQLVATNVAGAVPNNGTCHFEIGGDSDYPTGDGVRMWKGDIDEVAVGSGTPTAAQISALYLSGKAQLTAYADEVLTDNPLLFLRLNDQTGTTAQDTSGHNRDGTYNGAVTLAQPGLLDSEPADDAVSLDGTDDYISTPITTSQMPVASGFTWELLYSPVSGGDANARILSWANGDSAGGAPGNYYEGFNFMRWNDVTGATVAFHCYDGTSDKTVQTSAAAGDHFVCRYDGATTISLYKNGTLVGTATLARAPVVNAAPALTVGRCAVQQSSGWHYCKAIVDEISIYSGTLTAARIEAHYAFGTLDDYDTEVQSEASLQGFWKLEETSGTVAEDATANNRDGTYQNAPSLGLAGPFFDARSVGFNGIDERVTTPFDIADLGGDVQNITFECWAYVEDKTGGIEHAPLMYLGNRNAYTPANHWVGIDGLTTQATQRGASYDGTETAVSHAASQGAWHHFVFATDATTIYFYVDGVLRGTAALRNASINALATLTLAGSVDGNVNNFFKGRISRAAVYSAKLSDQRIFDHYAARLIDSTTAAPANTVAPAVTGTANVGETLSCSTGTWTGTEPITYAYQWQRSDDGVTAWTNIAGATASTYAVPNADYQKYLRCVVTATNSAGSSSANSNVTAQVTGDAPANTVAPVASGTPNTGEVLSCTTGTWTGYPDPTYTYQWQRSADGATGWAAIAGATGSTYTVVEADETQYLRCVVTGTNAVGSAAANSNNLGPTTGDPPGNTAAPSLSGNATVGNTLTCNTGTWVSEEATITYAYQWIRTDLDDSNPVNIVGATAATYKLQPADGGYKVKCRVTASDSDGAATADSNSLVITAYSPLTYAQARSRPFNPRPAPRNIGPRKFLGR